MDNKSMEKNTSEPWLGPTPLHVAIEKKNVGAVILLISVGAKTDMVSTEHKNMTQKEYIKYLLNDNKNDPDLKQISEYVRNPDVLKWAIKHPYKEITSYVKAGIYLKQKIPGANFIYKKLKNFIKSIRESFPEDLYSVGNNYSKIESSDKVPYRTFGRPPRNQGDIDLMKKLAGPEGIAILRKYKESCRKVEEERHDSKSTKPQ